MSFINDTKSELLNIGLDKDCCALAELSAIIHTSGALAVSRGGVQLEITGETGYAGMRAGRIIKKYFGIVCERSSSDGKTGYTLSVPAKFSEQILSECKIFSREDGYVTLPRGIDPYLIKEQCCIDAYIRGAFLGCGYLYVPKADEVALKPELQRTIGYHLEFVFSDDSLASDFAHILAQSEILPKKVLRKSKYVVYLKSGSQISDFLALIGANRAVMSINEIMATRDMRNKLMRETNCISANIVKSVTASMRQSEVLTAARNSGALYALPARLVEAAELRLRYPEHTLSELAEAADFKITKSGLGHRLNKLITLLDASALKA